MEWFIRAFIKASIVWFMLGLTLAVAMAFHPPWIVYRPAHAHMTLAGFLSMLVFGVGYQLLPRLFGMQLHSRRMAIAHWWLANIGLLLMVTGFVLQIHTVAGRMPLAAGGSLYALGAYGFGYNMWRTFSAAEARMRARAADPLKRAGLPTLE